MKKLDCSDFANADWTIFQPLSPAADPLDGETARLAAAMAAERLELVELLQGPFLIGIDPAEYDFLVQMTLFKKGYGR